MNIEKINRNSYAYREKLTQLSSPPKLLYGVGDQSLLDDSERKWVAIVGTRSPTPYGEEITKMLASELSAAGVIVISGLALGIDACAHQAVVEQGLPTVAVQARGLDEVYPSNNTLLGREIVKQKGLLISEYKVGVKAFKQNFIARNRLVAALADIIIVTEAALDSGSRHTVKFGLELNRTIMAVPGPINIPQSAWPNSLLRTGAIPITSTKDVMEELGAEAGIQEQPVKAESREEQILIDLLTDGVNQSEELIARSGLTAMEFANIVSLMEISGKITSLGAGIWLLRSN